jgi:hypothetical protein
MERIDREAHGARRQRAAELLASAAGRYARPVALSLVAPLPCLPSPLCGRRGFADGLGELACLDALGPDAALQSPAFGSGLSMFSPTGFGFGFEF